MARNSSIRIKKQSIVHRLTPDSWHDYLEHKFKDIKAFAIAGSGVFLFLSLVTYHSGDPSLNTAGTHDSIHNWMGYWGAVISDLLVQIFGIGSLI
jgi:S-DNA-T family DNA segregation ATPase FtsK/SpoIIIE